MAVVTNLSYPVADLILAGVVLAVLVVRGWLRERELEG